MALEMFYETEVLGRSVSAANRRTDLAQLVREARRDQAQAVGTFLGDVIADALMQAGRVLKKVAYAVESWRQRRATYGELSSLDDRLLSDIGIQRADIPAIADAAGHRRIVGGRVTPVDGITRAV